MYSTFTGETKQTNNNDLNLKRMASPTVVLPADTDAIGEVLQREYGHKDPDTPIVHYYVRLGQEISQINKDQLIEVVRSVLPTNRWVKAISNWDGLVIFKFSETSASERARDADVNEHFRLHLMDKLKRSGNSPVHMMFTRACLYKEASIAPQTRSVTTDDIGNIIVSAYKQSDPLIEYFYLFIQAEINGKCVFNVPIGGISTSIADVALAELKALPGDWSVLNPQDTWPGVIFGFYPKGLRVLTEREREKRLNGEVRIPLIDKLEEKLAPIRVHIIITRACKYTSE